MKTSPSSSLDVKDAQDGLWLEDLLTGLFADLFFDDEWWFFRSLPSTGSLKSYSSSFFGRKKDIVLSSCPRTLVIHFPLEGLLDFRARLVFYFTHACLHELWRVRERLESWRRWCWRRRSCSFGVSFFPPFYSGEQIKGEDLLHLFHLFFSYPLSRIYNRRNARDFSVCEHHVHFEAKNRQTIRDYDPEKNARVEAEKTIQGLHFSDFFFFSWRISLFIHVFLFLVQLLSEQESKQTRLDESKRREGSFASKHLSSLPVTPKVPTLLFLLYMV